MSSKHDNLPPAPIRTEALQNSQQNPAKPLPALPSGRPSKHTETGKKMDHVLASKSTNANVVSKGSKIPAKPIISSPVLISSSTDPFAGTAATRPFVDPSLAQLERRISILTQQADAQEAETKAKEKRLAAAEASFKPSPLQRGRSVLTTAKHAVARRLNSPHIKLGRFKAPLNRALSNPGYAPIAQTSEPISFLPSPLPVYESMRSRRETPEPREDHDPFSDKMEMDDAWSDFDIIFDRHKDQGVGLPDCSSSRSSSKNAADEATGGDLLVQPKSILSFSNQVSGLKQHPNPEIFSSSPVGFSTPRVRLEPVADDHGKTRLSAVLVRDPSLHDISSGQESTDDEDDPLIRNGTNAVYGSRMKRKSATEILESQSSKRAKTDSGASGGTLVLAKGFDQLDTKDGRSMEGNERIAEDMASGENVGRDKGFGIFDTSKGKEAENRYRDSAESLSIRRHSRQRSSSLSRPTSVLFSRESRARVPLLGSYKEEQMDIDELQMDDSMVK